MGIKKHPFGKTNDGEKVDLYTLTNANGLSVKIMTYGGIVTSLQVPGCDGSLADIVLGLDRLDDYLRGHPYFGAIVGRYANRISKARFTLEGVEYTLATNDGENHVHGGIKGFDKVVWNAEPVQSADSAGLKLTYLSKDGEEGYPGNFACRVTYILTNDNELKINYQAETDKPTVFNLTHHSYFNLAGYDSGDVLAHELMLNADHFTVVDENSIPTGEIKPVRNTPMDFTSPMPIGSRIAQVKGGYDHNYVINSGGGSAAPAASVYEPMTGRVLEIFTTEPGIHLYTGNYLDGSQKGKGTVYNKHSGFCLETEHFPDSPNRADFPSTVLRPGEKYSSLTVHRFSVK